MKNSLWILCCLVIVLVGCADKVVQTREVAVANPNVTPTSVTPISSGSVITTETTTINDEAPVSSGVPSWASETITVTGEGAVNPAHSGNPGQARLGAERAARADAYRKINEQVLGIQLDSRTTVKDFVTENDQINTRVSGCVKNAVEIDKKFDGETASVTLKLPKYDIYTIFKEERVFYK